jgi:sigma-E factor negative regulatory protein RseC
MMLETRAVVLEVDKLIAQVQANQGNGCSACNGKGCGSGKLTQLFCSKPRQFQVANRIGAQVGDDVIVSVPDGAVMRGVGIVYILPLILMFAGASLLGSLAAQGAQRDGYAAAGALSGLVLGFLAARWLSSRQSRQQPFIARQYSE